MDSKLDGKGFEGVSGPVFERKLINYPIEEEVEDQELEQDL